MILPKTSAIPPATALTRRRVLATGLVTGLAGGLFAPALLRPAHAAAPVDVAGPEALARALRAAAPGTVLRLAPGAYGRLAMNGGGGTPGAPVTLTAADAGDPPSFARMDLREVAHLVLDGLQFDYRFAADDKLHLRPFQVVGATGLALRRCRFTGDRARGVSPEANGFGTGFGLALTGCREAVVEGCEITDFYRGLVVHESRSLAVRGNDLHTIRMDGMNFAQVQDVVIEGNHIHDFNRSLDSKDHADMIQFWTNRTSEPSTGIVIRGNLLSSGRGWYTQSIFMRNDLVDRGLAGPEMFYRDITIEENVIANAHLHGITVGETEGLTIHKNTLLRNARSEGAQKNVALWTPMISVAKTSREVMVEANVVAKINGFKGQHDWRVARNVLVQDVSRIQPGFYDTVLTGDPADPAGLRYRAGGPLDGAGVGASRLQG